MKRWQRNFDEAAPALAEYFGRSVADRSSRALKAVLKMAGFTVKFKRSVQTGLDFGQLTQDLQEQFGDTRRRAAFMARDQNNKATASMTRAPGQTRITQVIWVHSGVGKHPRSTPVAMNGKKYDVNKGMWDEPVKRWVYPGEETNCRCSSRPVIFGFS
ncbi:phage minor head protein [Bradyrhizobium sp. STM 3843]|uniref:phage minor head protein n=1 Tax=Bradyrhizobium sp. STM 3843 TaxID=551947 RepID=UPI0002D74D88|nr:phage minor head protein [Bradyrhizobium sp. STM 3843]